jgi:uncharacterized protein
MRYEAITKSTRSTPGLGGVYTAFVGLSFCYGFCMGTSTNLKLDQGASYDRVALNALIGFLVGFAGGLVGLGGAELRLPYLKGTLRLPLKIAIPVNLAVSLTTLLAALPTRLYTLRIAGLAPFLRATGVLVLGAILGAYLGVNWLRHLSSGTLQRAVFGLLMALGVVMVGEAFIKVTPLGLLPMAGALEIVSGLALGFGIGATSGLLGVAGGEVIIPILVLGFGAPIKAAGSLSQMVSIPTVLTGFVRHLRAGAISDRKINSRLVLPMSIGAVVGGVAGGLLVSLAPSGVLKAVLGIILIASAFKVFGRSRP